MGNNLVNISILIEVKSHESDSLGAEVGDRRMLICITIRQVGRSNILSITISIC